MSSTPHLDNAFVNPFRFRGLWLWNPVSCLSPRSYDEKHMMANSDWFFDQSFMARYFAAMARTGLNTWILANTHPFPFMVALDDYPEARVLSAGELARYQAHYHWLFATALDHGIQPFVMFHTCYVPDKFGTKHDIRPEHSFEPPQLAYEYTRYCVRQLCDSYPELAGIHAEASENVATDLRAGFAKDAIVAGIHDSRDRPILFFRGWISDPDEMKANVLDEYEGECFFSVKYTWEFLIDSRPDPEFRRWLDSCGAERVLPEFWISNYQPFGCHDLEFAAALREQIGKLGCPGFTSQPMDLYGAPFVQGVDQTVLQLDRDHDWFATLTRDTVSPTSRPKTAMAACRPSQRISYFVTANKQNFHQPQWLVAVGGPGERRAGLFTFQHWSKLGEWTDASFGRWPTQLDGLSVSYPTEANGDWSLKALLDELAELDAQWTPPEPAGDPITEARNRDFCGLRNMAHAWTLRAQAVLAHFAEEQTEVVAHLEASLGLVKNMSEIMAFDGPYRLLVGRHTLILRWSQLADALSEELNDYRRGQLQDYYYFGEAVLFDGPSAKDFV